MATAEQKLRDEWTSLGVPQDRQDELIETIQMKAQPGAMVGPFRVSADFCAHENPVHAVACPQCHARAGVRCVRPSGHTTGQSHAARCQLADAVFIEQHGRFASIDRDDDGHWWIDARGRTGPGFDGNGERVDTSAPTKPTDAQLYLDL